VFDSLLLVATMIGAFGVFLLIIFLYVISGHKQIFFAQQRIGYHERTFTVFKFRTLKSDSSLPLEQRQFLLGRFLRFTSLDELPQLLNILKGEMSFIGPRPLPSNYLPLFSDTERARHSVLPGITGWAQVNGRHNISWKAKFDYDLYYAQHLSFWFDIRILVRTAGLLVFPKKDVSLLEKEFRGND
jgi:undecaprenyl phosphate N,N'-diacetylbacillosamine 1-phosphate transferase